MPTKGYLPRLSSEHYRGRAAVFWTYTVEKRGTGWLGAEFHQTFRELLLHASVREHLFCPVYILMPDHLHLIWMGMSDGSDQRRASVFLRQQLEPWLTPYRWQHQAHDRVLRDQHRTPSAFAAICSYIAQNPVRSDLASGAQAWPFTGCMVPGYPSLHPLNADFWGKFWRIYNAAVVRGSVGKISG